MKQSIKNQKKILWISHRGYKLNAAENTLEAFQAAKKLGFSALETDLRSTKDNHIVLIHDPDTKRLTGQSGQVCKLTRAQLEKYQLTGGGKFLFLDDFISEFSNSIVTLDIKPENGERTIKNLGTWITNNELEDWVSTNVKFLAWNQRHESMIKKFFPGIQCYARKNECWRAGLAALSGLSFLGGIKPGRIYALVPRFAGMPLFRKSIICRYHHKKALTVAYLPETEKNTQAAIAAGFDEILTNGKII